MLTVPMVPHTSSVVTAEARPLLDPEQRRRRRPWLVFAASLFVGSCVAVALSSRVLLALRATTVATLATTHADAPPDVLAGMPRGDAWACAAAEAAGVDPDLCGAPDRHMCDASCVEVEDSWCAFFCGDACAAAVGALCVFARLSNLSATCAAVAANLDRVVETRPKPPHFVPAAVPDGLLWCDYYSWCDSCVGDCPSLVAKPVPPLTAAGRAATLLNDIARICGVEGA